VSDQVVS